MAGKSPLNVAEIKEKIDSGKVKVKGKRKPNANKNTRKEHSVKGVNCAISDAEVIDYLKTQDGDVTSTQIRGALGFQSRTLARRVLRGLARAGKVSIGTEQLSEKRQIFTFELA